MIRGGIILGNTDLHIHIKNNSDNKKGETIVGILKEAIQNNTYTIALTSHNTLEQYTELFYTLQQMKNNNPELYKQVMDKMKFAIGVEINSRIENNFSRDMLVYNIPIERIPEVQKWLKENTNRDMTAACQFAQLVHFKNTADKLNIPYQKDAIMSKEQVYAGMVFATAVKNKIDDMLADILTKENPISNIFKRLLEEDEEVKQKIENIEDIENKKQVYKEILNSKELSQRKPQIEQIKQLYYQIIDLRLFANQKVNRKTVDQEIRELKALMKQEFKENNADKLDKESMNLINAELYSKFFEKGSTFFDVSSKLSSLKEDKVFANKDYKQIKLALYYSIAEQINDYIKRDRGIKRKLREIQDALIESEISFADILERLNWFNSELVRPGDTPFSFDTIVFKPKVEDVIEEMHKVGAIVEVAHPHALDSDHVREYMQTCAEKGVDGVEAFYCLSPDKEIYRKQKDTVQKFCKDRGLICNHGGTDYHQSDSEKVGILRCGEQISEEEIADQINCIPANEFMRRMEKYVVKSENTR